MYVDASGGFQFREAPSSGVSVVTASAMNKTSLPVGMCAYLQVASLG